MPLSTSKDSQPTRGDSVTVQIVVFGSLSLGALLAIQIVGSALLWQTPVWDGGDGTVQLVYGLLTLIVFSVPLFFIARGVLRAWRTPVDLKAVLMAAVLTGAFFRPFQVLADWVFMTYSSLANMGYVLQVIFGLIATALCSTITASLLLVVAQRMRALFVG
jgi:hypothetical protein